MADNGLYRQLVPDAPAHRRTERDTDKGQLSELRLRAAKSIDKPAVAPGLQKPQLVSSWAGTIDQILFTFPAYGVDSRESVAGYRSVIEALRPGTKFVVVHARSKRAQVEEWFTAAGHSGSNVTYVPLPDYVNFTDWAEDGYVALTDEADNTAYLMEPWEFPRAGDALISEAVQEYAPIRSDQAPLIFQGGNCLIGNTFWFLGKDYFADSVALLERSRPPVTIPEGDTSEAFVRRLFSDYIDRERKLVVIGTSKPIPVRQYYGSRENSDYFLDVTGDGAGTFQPIFHIDMFLTLMGEDEKGGFRVLVGSPSLGDQLLGTTSPYSLDDVYDSIAADLTAAGMNVQRNPLVHRPTIGRSFTLSELRKLASEPGNEEVVDAVAQLLAAGAKSSTSVSVRSWHHVTWNNCLVENSGSKVGRHVYLPTFGHGTNSDLKKIDDHMEALWAEHDFTVHMLADFNSFALRLGVVHCIKKYLRRGD